MGWTQLFKRLPVNLRPLLGVAPGWNAKGLALFARGCLALARAGEASPYEDEARRLLARLREMRNVGYSGDCWGYNFDWQARAFFIPRGTPNVVTTVFVAHAMCDAHGLWGEPQWLAAARGACRFILENLNRTEGEEALCFSYSPRDSSQVLNASVLAAGLLARVSSLTGERELLEPVRKAVAYALERQRPDGSWAYGAAAHHSFVDSFHTGFTLEALEQCRAALGDDGLRVAIQRGLRYYADHFFRADGAPGYYDRRLYPIDCHCAAQGVLTLLALREYDPEGPERARRVARWTVREMQGPEGCFYHQKMRYYTNKVPYIRWGQGWMFCALATLHAYERTSDT